MSDLISRADALSCFRDWIDQRGDVHTADEMPEYQRIEQLPSAQPERSAQPESAREYCAECDHIEMCRWYPYEGCEFRSLPSAQPEQPEIIRCGECKYYTPVTAHCEIRGKGLYLIRGMEDFCSRAERRTDEID